MSSGASGCAKHTFLAAVLFCVAVEASSLTDRESKEAAPLPDSALDARLKREPKEELVRRCKEGAQPPLRVATFACARVIHRAMQVRRERRKRANEASATKKYPSAAEAGKISGWRGHERSERAAEVGDALGCRGEASPTPLRPCAWPHKDLGEVGVGVLPPLPNPS